MTIHDDFIWKSNIAFPAGITREEIESLSFLDKKENLIMLGAVGTGKTLMSVALSLMICQRGKHTRFFTAASLANSLLERNNKGTLNSFLSTLNKVELMVISVVLLRKSRLWRPDFFPVRYERKSLIITSKLEFNQ